MSGLAKQWRDIVFGTGVDQKTSSKVLVLEKMAEVENARFVERGATHIRFGTEAVGTYTSGDRVRSMYSLDSTPVALTVTGSDGYPKVKRYTNEWLGSEALPGIATATVTDVLAASAQANASDCASAGGVQLFVSCNSTNVEVMVKDEATGAIVYGPTRLYNSATTKSYARAIAIDSSTIMFGFRDETANGIVIAKYTISTKAVATHVTIPLASIHATKFQWDWALSSSGFLCVATQNAANTAILTYAVDSIVSSFTSTTLTGVMNNGIAVSADPTTGNFTIVWTDATPLLKFGIVNSAPAVVTAATTLGMDWATLSLTATAAISCCSDGAGSTYVAMTVTLSGSVRTILGKWLNSSPATATRFYTAANDWELASKIAFSTVAHFCVRWKKATETCVALVSDVASLKTANGDYDTAFPRARVLWGTAGENATKLQLPTLALFGSNLRVALPRVYRVEGTNIYQGRIGIALCDFELTQTTRQNAVEFNDELLITGGLTSSYADAKANEQGFIVAPQIRSLTAGGPGNMSNGTYLVCIFFEYRDAKGKLHRSRVSAAQSITLSAGTAVQGINISYSSPGISCRIEDYATIGSGTVLPTVVVCRTLAGGSQFYESNRLVVPSTNWSFVTTLASDATVQTNALLYTEGGEVNNFSVGATRCIAAGKSRVVVDDADDPDIVYISKLPVAGLGTQFSPNLAVRIPSAGGPRITALAAIDDLYFASRADTVYYWAGNGPDNTNQGSDFGAPRQVAGADVGAVNQAGVVTIPGRVIMRTTKGFYSVGNDLSWQYIGADVEDSNALTVLGSCVVTAVNEAHFLMSDYTELVYNYEFGSWSKNTDFDAGDIAAVSTRRHFSLRTQNARVGRTSATFSDGASGGSYFFKIATPWIKFSSLQGVQRIYEALILLGAASAGTVQVSLSFDYSASVSESHTFSGIEQAKIPFNIQTCQVFKITLYAYNVSGDCSFAGASLWCGVKPGSAKLPIGSIA